jgi:hypothetical protein
VADQTGFILGHTSTVVTFLRTLLQATLYSWSVFLLKTSAAVLVLLCSATGGAFAQQQTAPVKMECRDLSTSGNVVFPNETLVAGLACHVVNAKPSAAQPAAPIAEAPPQPQQSPSSPAAQAASLSRVPDPGAAPAAPPAPTDIASMRINAGSTVYVAPMDGFENYLQAALRKKDVPLMPIADESKANYIIRGTAEEKKAGWTKMAFMGQIHSDDAASVQMIDHRTGAIVFAYTVNKKNTLHGQQTTAEACAKHLKEQIEK